MGANTQRRILCDHYGFREDQILMLSDDQRDSSKLPTKKNIQNAIQQMLDGAESGDTLVFTYSGCDTTYFDGVEDHFCLCPLDCFNGSWPESLIIDNEFHNDFYSQVPEGVSVLCCFD